MDKSNEMYVHYHCQNVVQNGSRDDHKSVLDGIYGEA